MRNLGLIAGTTLALLGLLVLAGNAGDSGCGGGVKGAQQLCQSTGGTWDDGICPSYCWPPQCGEPVGDPCIELCGNKPVCSCPKQAPYWQDGLGCLSASECSPQPSCATAGGECGALTATGLLCPPSHPTPWGEAGTCLLGGGCCI